MRVVSMVPSWTETLIECGADVVGRTRFCIHPSDKVKSIPAVGGTKDLTLEKLRGLNPDLLILDQEENPKSMAELTQQVPTLATLATHICSIEDVAQALRLMAEHLKGDGGDNCAGQLRRVSERWDKIVALSHARRPPREIFEMPGVIEWIRKPTQPVAELYYLIWKNPYMVATPQTFIGSVLSAVGFGHLHATFQFDAAKSMGTLETGAAKYPEVNINNLSENALLLFSSEPFPFTRYRQEIAALPFASALVDGESFSWFGVRALRFLEQALQA